LTPWRRDSILFAIDPDEFSVGEAAQQIVGQYDDKAHVPSCVAAQQIVGQYDDKAHVPS
jgi:hypothetical protein